MICGLCGGTVRGYSGTLHGRPIKDWKHASVPPGTQPHRPVLGTPVDPATLDRIHRPPAPEVYDVDAGPAEILPPIVPPCPATAAQLEESQSASQLLTLLELHRWTLVEPPAYFMTAKGEEFMVAKARRNDLGVVAAWRRRPERRWELDDAYQLGTGITSQVGSKQLKDFITQREERCPDCGRSSAVHGQECT